MKIHQPNKYWNMNQYHTNDLKTKRNRHDLTEIM